MVRAHDLLRLSRSLLDFAGLVDRFDRRTVSFVSVTQQFNTTSSLGSLTLNFLLSFAQFEREIIGERTRDIIDCLGLHYEPFPEEDRRLPGCNTSGRNSRATFFAIWYARPSAPRSRP